MHATDPDDIVNFILLRHRLGFFDLQAVRDVSEFVFRTAEFEQARAHGGMEIEEVDLTDLLTPALSSRGGEGGDSAATGVGGTAGGELLAGPKGKRGQGGGRYTAPGAGKEL